MVKKDPFAGIPEGKLTLEQARQVISAHRDAEARAQRDVAQRYVGKFYRYRNTYGGDKKPWWLYVAVTEAFDGGSVGGWTFQHTTDGEFQARVEKYIWVDRGGYEEITAPKFWDAWQDFRERIQNVPGSRKRKRAIKRVRTAAGRRSPNEEQR